MGNSASSEQRIRYQRKVSQRTAALAAVPTPDVAASGRLPIPQRHSFRHKKSLQLSDVKGRRENDDLEEYEAIGTLRGALQGKGEHVVYGYDAAGKTADAPPAAEDALATPKGEQGDGLADAGRNMVETPLAAPHGAVRQYFPLDDMPPIEDSTSADGDDDWTHDIPEELVEWAEWAEKRDEWEYEMELKESSEEFTVPPPLSAGVQPPSLPAQLEKGPLNHAAFVTPGSGDDNSILPKPDHSVINHLAASPIKGGFLSVGITTRYRKKFITVVYYKALGDAFNK